MDEFTEDQWKDLLYWAKTGKPLTSIVDTTWLSKEETEKFLRTLPDIEFEINFVQKFPCSQCGRSATIKYVFRDGTSILSCEEHRVDSRLE